MASRKVLPDIPSDSLYLLDIPTTARKLSTTIFAVRELIRSNKLKFIAVGHKQLISPTAIQAFIADNEGYYSVGQKR